MVFMSPALALFRAYILKSSLISIFDVLSLVWVLPGRTTADNAHCSWWIVFFINVCYFKQSILVCVLIDRSNVGKAQCIYLLNSVYNVILQALYILVYMYILHGVHTYRVNEKVYTKFGFNLSISIRSQDIERKPNRAIMTEI